MPVFLTDPAEPTGTTPFETSRQTTSGKFLAQVIFSLPRVTVPAMLFAVLWQVGESAVPVVMGIAIDRALGSVDAGQLVLWTGVLVGLYVVLTTAARFSLRLNAYVLQLLQYRLRSTLSRAVLHPTGGVSEAPEGSIVSVMTNDVTRLANAGQLLITPVSRIAAIVFIAVSLLSAHWLLGVVVFGGAPLAVWLMGRLSERYSRDTRVYQGLLAATVGRATDLVAGYRVVKGIRAEDEVASRYRAASQQTLIGAKRNAGLLGRFLVTSGAVSGIFVAFVMGLAGWLAVDGRISIGGFIAVVGLTQALLPHIETIANGSIPNYASARASSTRILEVLLKAGEGSAGPGRAVVPVGSHGLPALEVTVPGTRARGTVTLRQGELVGVRADDRTAAHLAETLLSPWGRDEVRVRVSGVPADDLTAPDYRRLVTVAPHRTTLFGGTVHDNIAADTSCPTELVATALRAACCEDFADPEAFVGEGGNRLSGGQQQRVALARALAADAPVLVLHDPTTAVDSVTEHLVAGRLKAARTGRSTLLIASSPVLLDECDRVVDLTAETGGRTA